MLEQVIATLSHPFYLYHYYTQVEELYNLINVSLNSITLLFSLPRISEAQYLFLIVLFRILQRESVSLFVDVSRVGCVTALLHYWSVLPSVCVYQGAH